jgi:glutaminyl-tRNA synthetase
MSDEPKEAPASNFMRHLVDADVKAGKNGGKVATRFPPEPNGYLHIGHAKSICLNFGLAKEFGGTCNLRMDDTNPLKEEQEYVDAIKGDVNWLGFQWDGFFHASDYFGKIYDIAEKLVEDGKAYVCELTEEEVRKGRGTVTEAGQASPGRKRTPAENLDLLRRMKNREFPDGKYTLRAKIDMASPNMKMRDPPLYRIRHAEHQNTGNTWCIYPLYDFAHALSDAIEGITHSICTLEFENNRELYDWFIANCRGLDKEPHQYEFARLVLTYTMMSKRKLLLLVNEGHVRGWDDPRMPTIAGIRRLGYTPEAIRDFSERIGVSKANSVVEYSYLESCVRSDLNARCARVMAVLKPLKLVIENFPENEVEELEAINFPEDPAKMGSRKLPFSRELYIEREDFMEEPVKQFHRLAPGKEVRLRWAYFVKCTSVVKNDQGEITEVRCTYDPATKGGSAPDGRKVKGTIHWVSARHAKNAEVRLYEQLFTVEDPAADVEGVDWRTNLSKSSLTVITDAKIEASLATAPIGERYQFERTGYFCVDPDSKPDALVFNRTIGLRDSFAKAVAAPPKK